MTHLLVNIFRTVGVRCTRSQLPNALTAGTVTTRETWHSTLPGMALLLAGASTVCLCESESRRASPATSVRAERLVCNTHTANWRVYTDKAVQLAQKQKLKDAEKHMSVALTEAIKGYGADNPHTAEARQNLADRYWEMQKYDLAIPLYIEVVDSLTSIYGPHDARTATALHNLAGLYMAQKDVLAASKTMLRAIEARRLALVPSDPLWSPWPAVAESVRGLAAIYRESGRSVKEVAEFLEKDLRFLTKEGKGLAPGVVVMIYVEPSEYKEHQKGAAVLSDAEAICRALISNLKNHPDRKDSRYVLSSLCETLARLVKAQGRLSEARQLCEEANDHSLAYSGDRLAVINADLPALELLIEIELEEGSEDSLRAALAYRQQRCVRARATLERSMDPFRTGDPVEWYSPGSYVARWIDRGFAKANQHASWYHSGMAHSTLSLIEAMQRLAEVQGRLGEHLDAWATLTEALPLLQSSVLAQAMELMEARNPTSASYLWEKTSERKQEIQHRMSASYTAICSPLAASDGNAEQCVRLQQQLTATLAA